jgi:hypothetical protein
MLPTDMAKPESEASNLFDQHGPIQVRPGDRYLTHADGTPFFYLADTAWNGPLRSDAADWEIYLADRKAKGFTAIQFIGAAPWSGCYTDAEGQTAFHQVNGSLQPNEKFFKRMDERIAAINRAGLLAVAVLAWAANFGESGRHNPGVSLSREQLKQWVGYQVQRYSKHQIMWLLAGDGKYGGWRSWKWKRLGREIFGSGKHAPVGLHPQGLTRPYKSFAKESWLDIFGYQSGHADDERTAMFLADGKMARQWPKLAKPIINLEPCYEGIHDWARVGVISNSQVRRAIYASLLNTPTAGVSYGAHGVWSWETQAVEPLNHPGVGVAMPWRQAMDLPGSRDVKRLRELFKSLPWWELGPADELVMMQGWKRDKRHNRLWNTRYRAHCAATGKGELLLLYLPFGGCVQLNFDATVAEWFDPRTGDRRAAMPKGDRLEFTEKKAPSPYPSPRVHGEGKKAKETPQRFGPIFTAPSDDDWVLICHSSPSPRGIRGR